MKSNRLKRYRVLESLGKGGSGEVFLGIDPFNRPVAIKIQRRSRKRRRFMQEYKLLNEFPHPSLVQVHEFGLLDGGWSYLVLGLIEGKSATGHVRSLYGSERLYKCIQIAIKISEAFGSLHQMGWIHGDIKSNNILVDSDGNPNLIDFELARPLESTGKGKFFGTRSYAPPEQHEGKSLTSSVDVYAMAGVLYRMITNKVAFERVDNSLEAENRRTTTPNISKRITSPLKDILLSALDQHPENRPQNGYQLADQLRDCLPLPETAPVQDSTPPAIVYLCETLAKNQLDPSEDALHLWSLTGGDPSLVNQFAYHKSKLSTWISDEYHQQVWHYLQHLPESTQRALYILACLGGTATTALLHKFAGVSRRQITKELQKLTHWVRKDGNLWNLYVGSTHHACLHLLDHEDGLSQLFNIQSSVPKWSKICVEALHHPENILDAAEQWIHTTSNLVIQWRLLKRLEEHSIELPILNKHLIARQNGDWLEALQLQNDPEAAQLISIFRNPSATDITKLEELTHSTNFDVWTVSHALLSEWHLLHGQFITAEKWLKPLCAHNDSYPRLLGLQQRALLHHHLDQQSRLSETYKELDSISCRQITEQIRLLIANHQWVTNLWSADEVSSLYLQVRKALVEGIARREQILELSDSLPMLERSFLAVHALWSDWIPELNLPAEPKADEFRYVVTPEDNLSCSDS